MGAALLAAVLFAISAICGYRSATQIGGTEANFWRSARNQFAIVYGDRFLAPTT